MFLDFFAKLAWPLVVLLAVIQFRIQIAGFIERIVKLAVGKDGVSVETKPGDEVIAYQQRRNLDLAASGTEATTRNRAVTVSPSGGIETPSTDVATTDTVGATDEGRVRVVHAAPLSRTQLIALQDTFKASGAKLDGRARSTLETARVDVVNVLLELLTAVAPLRRQSLDSDPFVAENEVANYLPPYLVLQFADLVHFGSDVNTGVQVVSDAGANTYLDTARMWLSQARWWVAQQLNNETSHG